MGFTKPDLPDVDPDTFMDKPLMERMRILATDWVDNGFGSPKMVHSIYIAKLVFLYALGGVLVATLTSGLPFLHVSQWWNQPIVYEKAVLWTVVLELIGVAGSWGILAGKIKPMTGGILFWARPGTIRLRPWKWVPFTGGDRRTWFDVVLYIVLMISVAVPLFSRGVHSDSLSAAMPGNTSGLVNPALLIAPIVLLVLMGLRDKIVFLAARGEQYMPALIIFAVFPFVNMIVALKLLIVVVWVGAGVSKLGLHFTNVIPPMVSNSPFIPFRWLKRAHYRSYPNDLRPSHLASLMAHGPGSVVEILAPLTLLFSPWPWLTVVAAVIMVAFHLFIISTFPLAVPLEWNVLFAYATIFLFLGFPAWKGYAVTDMSPPWLAILVTAALLFYPILGNFRPDKVSFLPSMRQYAGNWASAVWAFAPGAEAKLNRVTRTAKNQVDQFVDIGYEPQMGRCHHAAGDFVADVAQPGPGPVLRAVEEPAGHRLPQCARGRVRLQLTDRVQLRRRSPARPEHDRGCSTRSGIRTGRTRGRLGGVPGVGQQGAALQGDRRGARRDRARHMEGRRRGRGAAVAAQRPDPDRRHLVARRQDDPAEALGGA